jgi:hypothetical protein
MWVQWLTTPGFKGGPFNAANRQALGGGGSVTYQIPDKGLAGMRFWPGFGCDGGGNNCRIGASGGPVEFGFTCPPEGCAPPIDSKFEASFGCIKGITDAQCQSNPSGAAGAVLGRNDWWNASAVDGYTSGVQIKVAGYCPVGPINDAPYWGPGGPAGGTINCLGLNMGGCPTAETLSTGTVSLQRPHPTRGGMAGCYSPSAKLTFSNWGNAPTFAPSAPEAQWYACPTPPISPEACASGPASRTKYRNYVHSVCPTYAFAYDDGFGLSTCPASTLVSYEVTFGCPP